MIVHLYYHLPPFSGVGARKQDLTWLPRFWRSTDSCPVGWSSHEVCLFVDVLHEKMTLSDCILCFQAGFCRNGEMSCKEVIWKVLSFTCSTQRKGRVESTQVALPVISSLANLFSSLTWVLSCRNLKKKDQEVKVMGLGLGGGLGSALSPVAFPTLVKEVRVTSAVLCRATWEVLRSDSNKLHRKAYKYIKFMNIYCTLHTEICQH